MQLEYKLKATHILTAKQSLNENQNLNHLGRDYEVMAFDLIYLLLLNKMQEKLSTMPKESDLTI